MCLCWRSLSTCSTPPSMRTLLTHPSLSSLPLLLLSPGRRHAEQPARGVHQHLAAHQGDRRRAGADHHLHQQQRGADNPAGVRAGARPRGARGALGLAAAVGRLAAAAAAAAVGARLGPSTPAAVARQRQAAALCPVLAGRRRPVPPIPRPPAPCPTLQVRDLTVWYGPDTYMGRNLAQLFTMLAAASDDEVRALHPAHTAASVRALLPRLRYFDSGERGGGGGGAARREPLPPLPPPHLFAPLAAQGGAAIDTPAPLLPHFSPHIRYAHLHAHTHTGTHTHMRKHRAPFAGTCIVHHIFGGEVCELVRARYGDAFLTAHFEVPGEMFTLAMEAKARGTGCVGSTSNILDFIAGKLKVGGGGGCRSRG